MNTLAFYLGPAPADQPVDSCMAARALRKAEKKVLEDCPAGTTDGSAVGQKRAAIINSSFGRFSKFSGEQKDDGVQLSRPSAEHRERSHIVCGESEGQCLGNHEIEEINLATKRSSCFGS
jgi:hypothetical protein